MAAMSTARLRMQNDGLKTWFNVWLRCEDVEWSESLLASGQEIAISSASLTSKVVIFVCSNSPDMIEL